MATINVFPEPQQATGNCQQTEVHLYKVDGNFIAPLLNIKETACITLYYVAQWLSWVRTHPAKCWSTF